jgi:hypothetical protein
VRNEEGSNESQWREKKVDGKECNSEERGRWERKPGARKEKGAKKSHGRGKIKTRKSFMSKEIERWEGKPLARKEEDWIECEENESGKKNHGRGEAFPFFPQR